MVHQSHTKNTVGQTIGHGIAIVFIQVTQQTIPFSNVTAIEAALREAMANPSLPHEIWSVRVLLLVAVHRAG